MQMGHGYPGSMPESQGLVFLQAVGRRAEEAGRANPGRQNVGSDARQNEFGTWINMSQSVRRLAFKATFPIQESKAGDHSEWYPTSVFRQL
jgi:hypothetical protein